MHGTLLEDDWHSKVVVLQLAGLLQMGFIGWFWAHLALAHDEERISRGTVANDVITVTVMTL